MKKGSRETSNRSKYVEWIRFLFLFRQDYQDYQEFFACSEGLFGRRPHYPSYPVDPVQLFSLK